jgi:flavin-binding protein dodecin
MIQMEQLNFIELIGSSELSLGDAIDNAISRSRHSNTKSLEVVETYTSSYTNKSNYKVKLKVSLEELA